MVDTSYRWHVARVVPSKGRDPYAIKEVGQQIENMGYNSLVVKSDQEPSIKELIRGVRRERPEKTQLDVNVPRFRKTKTTTQATLSWYLLIPFCFNFYSII